MMVYRAFQWVSLALVLLVMTPGMAKDAVERIAFQRNDPPAITVMFADGTGAVDLAENRLFTTPCITPALSSDGHTLAFVARVDKQCKIFTWRLDEGNAAVGEPKRLTSLGAEYSENLPSWSPDGKRVALLVTDAKKKTTLRVVNADGTGLVQLAATAAAACPTWSPDGRQLLYIDTVKKNPTLLNIPAAGGKGLPIHPEFKITAACFSPDGKQLAALVQQKDNLADLYVFPPFGIGGRAIARRIAGATSVVWHHPERIAFNASAIDGHTDKNAIWTIAPNGTGLHGLSAFADPRQIAYLAVGEYDATPYVPVAIAPGDPETVSAPSPDVPGMTEELVELLASHSVTILSPMDGNTVHGVVPLQIIARKTTASIAILVNGQFVYAVSTADATNAIPRITYAWNTRELQDIDPAQGLPSSYTEAQRYPDGAYTLCVQALDEGGKLLDQHIISVTVQNGLSSDALPTDTLLRYRFGAPGANEYFQIHGEGTLLGTPPQLAPELNATLDVSFRRSVLKALPNDSVGFRTEMRGPKNRYALTYGPYQVNIPELTVGSAYSMSPQGDLAVATIMEEKAYCPLAQLSLPLPDGVAHIGDRWEKPMWVVTDLLDREATVVNATHQLDGFERINGHRAARIRSTFIVNSELVLRNAPTPTMPGERGTRAKLLEQLSAVARTSGTAPSLPGARASTTTSKAPAVASIAARRADGVRYTWIDLDTQQLARVDDYVLYTIPSANLPSTTAPAAPVIGIGKTNPPSAVMTLPANVAYFVHYTYEAMPDPKTLTK